MSAPDTAASFLGEIERALEEQGNLSAVERFARWHEPSGNPAQQKYYRDLLPASLPAPGQQYAFEVDLDRCSGCQACVTACHSLNGLDERESWRSVGLLSNEDWRAPFQATVTTGCHHCADPGCLTGCPVLAYDKDPVTGIVRHLDDQCIGCQYCVMKCPYEVPQYSAERGIVRKCDMCSSRLAHGEAPACVQACPTLAIRITLVDTASTVAAYRGGAAAFLPDSPSPRHTVPTTRYVSARELPPTLAAGDRGRVSPAPAHLPLVLLLVLSQLAVGASCAAPFCADPRLPASAAALAVTAALAAGAFHLGQPLKAWRAFLGWRRSWFSREVIVFGVFGAAAVACAAAAVAAPRMPVRPMLALAAAAGLAGVACSAMLYADTPRAFWGAGNSFGRFFGSVVVLGLALPLAAMPHSARAFTGLSLALAAASAAKLAFEERIRRHRGEGGALLNTELGRTAYLLSGPLAVQANLRRAFGGAGGIAAALAAAGAAGAGFRGARAAAVLAFALVLAGELLERYLFFTAVSPDRMPGGRSP
ncbi:MAG TPA: 4Fe-4S dicluster domain-containing protein [Opitutaceae bacterium]